MWWERVPAAEHLRNGLGNDISACEGGDDDIGAYESEGVGVGGGEDALVEAGVAADGGAEGSGVVFGRGVGGGVEGRGEDGEGGAVAGAEY